MTAANLMDSVRARELLGGCIFGDTTVVDLRNNWVTYACTVRAKNDIDVVVRCSKYKHLVRNFDILLYSEDDKCEYVYDTKYCRPIDCKIEIKGIVTLDQVTALKRFIGCDNIDKHERKHECERKQYEHERKQYEHEHERKHELKHELKRKHELKLRMKSDVVGWEQEALWTVEAGAMGALGALGAMGAYMAFGPWVLVALV